MFESWENNDVFHQPNAIKEERIGLDPNLDGLADGLNDSLPRSFRIGSLSGRYKG